MGEALIEGFEGTARQPRLSSQIECQLKLEPTEYDQFKELRNIQTQAPAEQRAINQIRNKQGKELVYESPGR